MTWTPSGLVSMALAIPDITQSSFGGIPSSFSISDLILRRLLATDSEITLRHIRILP